MEERSKRKRISSFSPRWRMKGFWLVMGLFMAAIHVFSFRMMQADASTTYPLPFLSLALFIDACFIWYAYIFTTQSRVTIYDEGIELERGGSKLFTKWDNVSRLGVKGFGRNERRGIFLHHKEKPKVHGLVEKLIFGSETDFIPIGRYINLPRHFNPFNRSIHTEKLLETEFGQALYEYAPHLFDDYENMKPKNRLEDAYDEQDDYGYEDDEMMQDRKNG